MRHTSTLAIAALSAALTLSACHGQEKQAAPTADTTAAAAPSASTAGAPVAPAPGREVITIKLISDDKGNRFEPNDIEAKQGDVLRYTLVSGVHNVDFLPDSNQGKSGLPKATDMIQLPGQTYDIPVSFAPGHYYFQCDPHALLGMRGHLEVEK